MSNQLTFQAAYYGVMTVTDSAYALHYGGESYPIPTDTIPEEHRAGMEKEVERLLQRDVDSDKEKK